MKIICYYHMTTYECVYFLIKIIIEEIYLHFSKKYTYILIKMYYQDFFNVNCLIVTISVIMLYLTILHYVYYQLLKK